MGIISALRGTPSCKYTLNIVKMIPTLRFDGMKIATSSLELDAFTSWFYLSDDVYIGYMLDELVIIWIDCE